jgi:hypothetical protein
MAATGRARLEANPEGGFTLRRCCSVSHVPLTRGRNAHHHGIRVRARSGAQDVVRRLDVGDPVADRLRRCVLERSRARRDGTHRRPQQPHTEHVQRLRTRIPVLPLTASTCALLSFPCPSFPSHQRMRLVRCGEQWPAQRINNSKQQRGRFSPLLGQKTRVSFLPFCCSAF